MRSQVVDARALQDIELKDWLFGGHAPALVLGFISPHAGFDDASRALRAKFPQSCKVIAMTTAGELFSSGDGSARDLYLEAGERPWHSAVIQAFSPDLFEDVSIHTVDLASAGFRRNAK